MWVEVAVHGQVCMQDTGLGALAPFAAIAPDHVSADAVALADFQQVDHVPEAVGKGIASANRCKIRTCLGGLAL